MAWNWEQPEWPDFRWNAEILAPLEARFMQQSGVQIGSIRHFDEEASAHVLVDILTSEALKTSEIEGEILNRDSVQASILHHFGMETDHRRIPPAERGISDLLFDLHRNFGEKLTDSMMHRWHIMVTAGRTDLQDVGRYRSQGDPMQVVSGAIHKPKVHFEAPPSDRLEGEMAQFVKWFATTAPNGRTPMPPLTRAGLAHLYFVSIHPYEDGNGRIARALAEKALAQAIGQPTLLALSHTIQRGRKVYYDALEANNKAMDVTGWLIYFAETVLSAQSHSQGMIDFLIEKTKLFDRLRGQLNERQDRVLARMFREGPEGFKGGLSAANYITITGASRATATRDLAQLVSIGALTMTGTLKATRYYLNIAAQTTTHG